MARIDKSVLAIPARAPLQSERHRYFVACHSCVVCAGFLTLRNGPVSQCAHVNYVARKHDGMRGKGQKARDCWTVPMCPRHHEMQGRVGQSGEAEATWWREQGIDPETIINTLIERSPDPRVRAVLEAA